MEYPFMMAIWKIARRWPPGTPSSSNPATPPGEHSGTGAADEGHPARRSVQCGAGYRGYRLGLGQSSCYRAGFDHRIGACRHRGSHFGCGQLKRSHLELGGKAPAVVFGDVDIDKAAWGSPRPPFSTPARTVRPPPG
ncbi:aldehyde dehydrogenase family protein [Mycobacteroides abscessus]|nr:aldehyde dehydrogenase family protein [Mycobacteroides abscessus]